MERITEIPGNLSWKHKPRKVTQREAETMLLTSLSETLSAEPLREQTEA